MTPLEHKLYKVLKRISKSLSANMIVKKSLVDYDLTGRFLLEIVYDYHIKIATEAIKGINPHE